MDPVGVAADLDGELGDAVGAEGSAVDELHMRQIEQVVDDQPVVPGDMEPPLDRFPRRVVVPAIVGNRRGIGTPGIAHPDPDEAVALDHGKGRHAGARRYLCLARHLDAGAVTCEQQAVIAAADAAALDPAMRERGVAMDAAIG